MSKGKICLFGFVNVYKNELKIKDYNKFKAYYCGLCKTLGKMYNQAVRLGLSYDMTFLAIIADAVSEKECLTKKQGCFKHTGNRDVCVSNDAINYSSDMSIILAYHKLSDDISDNHSIKALLAKLAYIRAYKKACKKHSGVSEIIRDNLTRQSELEKQKCANIDEIADPFATLLSVIFANWNKSLEKIGYNIGRFIYIADSYSDIETDRKKGSYNPYLCAYTEEFLKTEEFKKSVMGSLNMTLSAIAQSYSKIEIIKNKEILDNIIYMGLRFTFDNLFKDKENGGTK